MKFTRTYGPTVSINIDTCDIHPTLLPQLRRELSRLEQEFLSSRLSLTPANISMVENAFQQVAERYKTMERPVDHHENLIYFLRKLGIRV